MKNISEMTEQEIIALSDEDVQKMIKLRMMEEGMFTQCPADFKNQIGNPDIVIVFTGTVAHKMVRVASGQAEKSGAIIKHCNSSSACALNDALTECFCKAV